MKQSTRTSLLGRCGSRSSSSPSSPSPAARSPGASPLFRGTRTRSTSGRARRSRQPWRPRGFIAAYFAFGRRAEAPSALRWIDRAAGSRLVDRAYEVMFQTARPRARRRPRLDRSLRRRRRDQHPRLRDARGRTARAAHPDRARARLRVCGGARRRRPRGLGGVPMITLPLLSIVVVAPALAAVVLLLLPPGAREGPSRPPRSRGRPWPSPPASPRSSPTTAPPAASR